MTIVSSAIREPVTLAGSRGARGYLRRLWARRRRIVCVTLLACIGSLAGAWLATPVYQANAMVRVGPTSARARAPRGVAATVDGAAHHIVSRQLLARVVDRLDLVIGAAPRRVPVIGGFIARHYHPARAGDVAAPWFGLNGFAWGGATLEIGTLNVPQSLLGTPLTLVAGRDHAFTLYRGAGTALLRGTIGHRVEIGGITLRVNVLHANPGTRFRVERRSRRDAIARIRAHLDVQRARHNPNLVTLHYRDIDPARAKAVLHAVVQQYLQSARRTRARVSNPSRVHRASAVRVVLAATVNAARPVRPRRGLIVIITTALGALVALAWACVRPWRRRLEDPRDIERLDVAVCASVPFSPRQRDIDDRHAPRRVRVGDVPHALAAATPKDAAIDAIRSLRTSLYFVQPEAGNQVVMVSAARRGAGRTFVCANLAIDAAVAGRRVLLIDGDLRHGRLQRIFGAGRGLSAVLRGRSPLHGAVRHTAIEGLDFVARGRRVRHPSRLLTPASSATLLDALAPGYDLIIIAAPPILAAPDAAIIGRYASTNLLVARFGATRAAELGQAVQRLAQGQVTVTGVVFNAVEARPGGYYVIATPPTGSGLPS